jgi:hypothetical protein
MQIVEKINWIDGYEYSGGAGKQVATKIGKMIVRGQGGQGKSGYIGQIKKGK